MYLDFYNLQDKPFQITCDPKYLWLSDTHKEALALLRYGILDNRGFLLLTGEVGTGKTLLINHLFTLLSKDMIAVTITDPDLSRDDVYRFLADGFNLSSSIEGKAEFLIQFRDFLHQSAADDKRVVLIVDEAHRLNHHLMEDLRTLSNIEFPDRKLINIFLVGQQELNQVLGREENRAFSQRITLRHQIEPLDQDETALYIDNRLKVAGGTDKIFEQAAIKKVFEYSSGIPRLINILCDHALLTGCVSNSKQIDAGIIVECAQELRIPTQHKSVSNFRHPSTPPELETDPPESVNPAVNKDSKTDKKEEELFDVGAFEHQPMRSRYSKWVVMGIIPLVAIAMVFVWMNMKDKIILHGYNFGIMDKRQNVLAEKTELSIEADEDTTHPPNPEKIGAAKSKDPAALPGEEMENILTIGWPESKNVPIEFDQENGIVISSLADMDQVADGLTTFPERMVYIHGFVKGTGSLKQRQMVWQQRVDAVKAYLANKGVSSYQIKSVDMDTRSIKAPVEGKEHLYAVIELPSDDYAIHYNQDK